MPAPGQHLRRPGSVAPATRILAAVPHNRLIWHARTAFHPASMNANSRRSESAATVEWSHCVMACRVALMAVTGQAERFGSAGLA